MPHVPYEPYTTAQPQGGGEQLRVQTPGAAFGENVGAAIENLGGTAEKVGGELFNRAIAIQNLANENAAREAQADYAEKSSLLHAQFGALTGDAAAKALPGFIAQQRQLREQIGSTLTNPTARKYFDADSMPFMQRNVFSAAGHAAGEDKKYTIESFNSESALAINAIGEHPDDDKFVATQRANAKQAITNAAMLQYGVNDPNDPNVVREVQDTMSRATRERILGKLRYDATGADQMFEKWGGDLVPKDRDAVQGAIENKGAAVAGVHTATSVLNSHRQSDGTYDVPALQLEKEVRETAEKALPKNELVGDVAVSKLHNLMGNQSYFTQKEQQDAKNQFNQIISDNDIQDVQGFMAMPGADRVIAKLPPNLRTAPQIQKYITNFQSSINKQTNEYWATTINGMRTSDSSAFMTIEPTDPKYHLNKQDILRVQNEQAAMSNNPQDDPRVSRAMGWLLGARGTELQALGVDAKHAGREEDFYHFRGAMQEAIQIFQEKNPGKQPTYEDIVDKIGPLVIKTEFSKPGMFWGTNQVPAFQEYTRPAFKDIPVEAREKITADFQKKGVQEPTEQEMTQIYARQLFNQLFPSSFATKSKTGDRVPPGKAIPTPPSSQ